MIFLYLIFIGILLGVVGSINIVETVRVSLLDIIAGLSFLYTLFNIGKILPLMRKDTVSRSFILFILVALISLILSPLPLTPVQFLISFMYIVRVVLYFSVFYTLKLMLYKKSIKKEDIYNVIVGSGIALSIIGWLQYFLYPDLRNLYYLGWDPHYKRIFSTFFDPNFLGLFLVISLAVLLFVPKLSVLSAGWRKYASIVILTITIFFTYSRSSLLVLGLLFIIYIWRIKKRIFLIPVLALFAAGLLILPRTGGEGVKLERVFSISQRIEHARLGLSIVSKYPILGVGFDALRYVKSGGEKGSMWNTSHAGAGLDVTLLFIMATTGITGTAFFAVFLYTAFCSLSFSRRVILGIVLVHSFSVNSFFFPFIFLSLWMLFSSE